MNKVLWVSSFKKLCFEVCLALFKNIFMAKVETEILNQSALKPLVWKRFIDDIFSLWNITREDITQHHQAIEFTAEVSQKTNKLLGHYCLQR